MIRPMRAKQLLGVLLLIGLFWMPIFVRAASLAANVDAFFDDFNVPNASKQDLLENIHFPPYIYNRSRSPLGAVLMEVVDPLNTGTPFLGVSRSSTNPFDAWDEVISDGDVRNISTNSGYTEVYFRNTTTYGFNHGAGLSLYPGLGEMSVMDAGATMQMVSSNAATGPGFGIGFGYYAENGAYVSVSLTYQVRGSGDMLYVEIWSDQYGTPTGPIFVQNLMPGSPGVWYAEHIIIDDSMFHACVNGSCADVTLSNVVSGGHTFNITPARLDSYYMTARAATPGEDITMRVRDAWAKWVTSGQIVSIPIYPPAGGTYLRFEESHQSRDGDIAFDILDAAGNVLLADVTNGQDLSGIGTVPIRLRARLSRLSLDGLSPVLDWWRVVGYVLDTPTPTPSATATPTGTSTPTSTATNTPTPTNTPSPTPTRTPIPSCSFTVTPLTRSGNLVSASIQYTGSGTGVLDWVRISWVDALYLDWASLGGSTYYNGDAYNSPALTFVPWADSRFAPGETKIWTARWERLRSGDVTAVFSLSWCDTVTLTWPDAATATPAVTPVPTNTPEPLGVTLQQNYAALLYMASNLSQPAQTLRGTVSGGSGGPYLVAITTHSPSGRDTAYTMNSTGLFILQPTDARDPDFGTTEIGTWYAWAQAVDVSTGLSASSSPVRWDVAWYPIHALP